MEFSTVFRASCGSIPSPNGDLIASIVPPKLVIRSATTLQVKRVLSLNPKFAANINFMKWSPYPHCDGSVPPAWNGFPLMTKRRSGIDNSEEEGTACQRVLLADDGTIQVFDVNDDKWTATISQGFGGIKNVEFGRNEDEVVVFSEFQMKVTVWNLITSKHVEIPDPKFSTRAGFGYRPCTSHFALLTRKGTHDVVSVHQVTNYRIVANFTLPTLDAQGLKWSPCGRWMAIWDSATCGYKVLIYTADGHLYRTYEKHCEGLGVKNVEWSPSGDFLTIGSYDGRLCFLSNYTFSPVIEMNHTKTVRLPGVTVWSEACSSPETRYYAQQPQPTVLPTITPNASDAQPKIGISAIAFNNPDGTLVASRNDCMPTTVWIWSLKLLRPYAVLVHINPIKQISWHPTIPELLMIQCHPDTSEGNSVRQGVIYLWSAKWKQPRACSIPMETIVGTPWSKWVLTPPPSRSSASSTASTSPTPFLATQRAVTPEKDNIDKRAKLLFGDKEGFVVGYVDEEPVPEGEALPEDDEDAYEKRWEPVNWEFYVPSSAPKRSPSSASSSQAQPISITESQKKPTLEPVTEPNMDSEVEDTFEYQTARPGVSVTS